MLIIKLFVNTEQIDEIHIQRVGPAAYWNSYVVRKPDVPGTVRHCRADGWVALGAVVLSALAEAGYGAHRPRDVTQYERRDDAQDE